MVYVSGGQILDSKPRWGLSIITDTFWGIIDFVFLFFRSLFMPGDSKTRASSSSNSRGDRWGGGGGGGPRRRMGGFGGSSNSPSPPPMAGGG
ncbi:DgyrCDS366 [Dimorphilus gyrociliatus]|uniref:DgyrCDS366 n=1 Tax=Dimorphilus gyrociliatus TaxID=2664684 RepID=A0A7I8V499_9ANNE|nr:DgyrCDS366 [Dimorphilus gyrociliatus]